MRVFFFHSVLCFVLVTILFRMEAPPLPYNALTTSLCFVCLFTGCWLSSWFYRRSYFRKLPKAVGLLIFFLKELLMANLKIAFDIVTPRYYMKPTVIALPLQVRTDLEITLLACIISLTPGTLSIDVSRDRRILYVHALYVKHNDLEKLKYHIKHGFERRLLALTS